MPLHRSKDRAPFTRNPETILPLPRPNATDKVSVLVVNAGTHPEPYQLAIGLAELGWHVEYLTGSQVPAGGLIDAVASRLSRRIRQVLAPRILPLEPDAPIHFRSAGLWLEILFVIARGFSTGLGSRVLSQRTRTVARRAAKILRRRGAPYDYVVAQQTCAYDAFMSAPQETRRVLLQPILDPRTLDLILMEEAAANPAWAPAIPGIGSTSKQSSEIHMADVVLTGSEFVAQPIRDVYKKKTIAVHYGASTVSTDRPPQQRTSETSPLRLLFAGQANQRKGIGYLLDAMREMGESVHLRIAGHASRFIHERCEDLRNVTLLGSLAKPDLYKEYLHADVLILPSLGEGFALVVLEAMSTGLPCIVTPHTGANEIIEDRMNGFVIPVCSTEAISATLREIVDDTEQLAAVGARAQETASRLTWRRFRDAAAEQIRDDHQKSR